MKGHEVNVIVYHIKDNAIVILSYHIIRIFVIIHITRYDSPIRQKSTWI